MKINLKQPKYILPLLALPFLVLYFYVYQSSANSKQTEVKQQAGINGTVGEVSDDIKKKELADKLDAYRNTYKEADGYTAVSPVPIDKASSPPLADNYSGREKKMLDSNKNTRPHRLRVLNHSGKRSRKKKQYHLRKKNPWRFLNSKWPTWIV
jgi:hypothetical protein